MKSSASRKISQPQLIDIKPLVDEGLAVHLLKPKEKRPEDEGWPDAAKLNYEELKSLHKPGQNFGLRLGKWSPIEGNFLHVLDFDVVDDHITPEELAAGHDAIERHLPQHMRAPRVRSGSAGETGHSRHFYCALQTPRDKCILIESERKVTVWGKVRRKNPKTKRFEEVEAWITKPVWKLELYGNTGQVVVPPSIGPSGNPYVWEVDLEDAIFLGTVPVISPEIVAAWKPSIEDEPGTWEAGGSEDLDEILEKLQEYENYDWLLDAMDSEPDQGQRSTHCQNVILNLMKRGCTDDEIDILANEYSFANKYKDRETGWGLEKEIRSHRKTWTAEGCKITPKDAGDLDFDDVSGDDDSDDAANDNKPKAPKEPKFKLYRGGAFEPILDGSWLIYEVVPATGLCMIYGDPGDGKSFVAMHMGLHIAAGPEETKDGIGLNWAGADTEHGPVIYIVGEGATGFKNRVWKAFETLGLDREKTPFFVITVPANLGKEGKDLPVLLKEIDRQLDAESIAKPKAIFIDTVASVTPGTDESKSDGMGVFIDNAQKIARHFECLTIGVHHRGKDAAQGLRGWSGLKGACDAVMLVERDDKDKVKPKGSPTLGKITMEKLKDGSDHYIFAHYELTPVQIGMNSKGKPVTTCNVGLSTPPDGADFDDVEKEENHKAAAVAALKDGPYRTDVQSKEKADGTKGWFGVPIAAALGLDPAAEADRRTIRKLVEDLITEGKLERFKASVGKNLVEFIKVIATKSPTPEVADDFENEDFST